MEIEIFPAESPPRMQRYGETLESGIVRGNTGSLIVLKLGPGLELAGHAHEQEYVGAVFAGEFSFTDGEGETGLRAGDLYQIPPNVTHGVRCKDYALVLQARADLQVGSRST